jgi:hypothetical protein
VVLRAAERDAVAAERSNLATFSSMSSKLVSYLAARRWLWRSFAVV